MRDDTHCKMPEFVSVDRSKTYDAFCFRARPEPTALAEGPTLPTTRFLFQFTSDGGGSCGFTRWRFELVLARGKYATMAYD